MAGPLLVGRGRELREVTDDAFTAALHHLPGHMAERLAFMSPEHHLVRDFTVRELPRRGRALSPRQIAADTGLDPRRVENILDELERHLFFLVRDRRGNVNWAYPVTSSPTAHHLTFTTGERLFGA